MANFARRAQRSRSIAIGEHGTAAPPQSIQAARDAHQESLHAARLRAAGMRADVVSSNGSSFGSLRVLFVSLRWRTSPDHVDDRERRKGQEFSKKLAFSTCTSIPQRHRMREKKRAERANHFARG